MKKLLTFAALTVLIPATTFAQEQYLELLRADLKAEKTAIVTDNLEMTEAQATIFWPIYREYDLKLAALQDERIALLKDYANAYDTMGGEMASTLVDKAFDLEEKRLKLRKEYYKKIGKAVDPLVAARFAHVESVIAHLVDLQIQGQVPMAPKPGSGGGQ